MRGFRRNLSRTMLSHVPYRAAPAPSLASLGISRRASAISPVVLIGLVRAADFAVVVLTGHLLAMLYLGDPAVATDLLYNVVIVLAGLATMLAFDLLGLYAPQALRAAHLRLPRLMFGWASALAAVGVVIFFLKAGSELSRAWLALWLVVGGVALAAQRLTAGLAISRL